MVSWKHKILKNSEKSVKIRNLHTDKDQRGILFETKIENWFPFEWNYIRYPENTKKSTFSWCFFVQKTMNAKIVNKEKYYPALQYELVNFRKCRRPKIRKMRKIRHEMESTFPADL